MKNLNSEFLIRIQNKIRIRHYSIKTEETYLGWVKQFILFHNKRHPEDMGGREVKQFLNYLVVDRKIAAATQDQFQRDLKSGFGSVYIPEALDKKYPNIKNEWGWQYAFAAEKLSLDLRSQIKRRHHYNEGTLQPTVGSIRRKW